MRSPAVLIAEEEAGLRQDLKGLLFCHGFEVVEVLDTAEVLQFFLDKKPDLVIVGSSRYGSWDELEVAEQIRQRDRKVPLILITRHSSEAPVIAALRASVSNYFKVPFSHRDDSTGVRYAAKSGERIAKRETINWLIELLVYLWASFIK